MNPVPTSPAAPAPPPAPKEPWWVETVLKFMNLALVVVVGTFIKCGTDSFSQNMERGKLVKDLLDDLSARKNQQEKVRQDISLLALDRFLVADRYFWNENWLWNQNEGDRTLVANISAVLFDDIQHDSTQSPKRRQEMLSVVKMVMQKNNRAIAELKLNQSYQAIQTRAISSADLTPKSAAALAADTPAQAPEVQALNSLQDKASTPLVYIQYRNPAEEAVARQIQAQCQRRGWKAPGIELINSKVNFDNSIRYYHFEDRDLADEARQVAQGSLAAAYPQQAIKVRLLDLTSRKMRAPTGQVEVWINAGKPKAVPVVPAPEARNKEEDQLTSEPVKVQRVPPVTPLPPPPPAEYHSVSQSAISGYYRLFKGTPIWVILRQSDKRSGKARVQVKVKLKDAGRATADSVLIAGSLTTQRPLAFAYANVAYSLTLGHIADAGKSDTPAAFLQLHWRKP